MRNLSLKQVQQILDRISFAPSGIRMHKEGDVKFEAKETSDGFLIRCSFWRPDTQTGEEGTGYGRWYHTSLDSSEKAIVMCAWLAFEQVVKHEMMECFLYKKVRIFDPHKSLDELAYPKALPPNSGVTKTFTREDLANEIHFTLNIRDLAEQNSGTLKVIWNFTDGNVYFQSTEFFDVFEQYVPELMEKITIGVQNAQLNPDHFSEDYLKELLEENEFVDKTESLL